MKPRHRACFAVDISNYTTREDAAQAHVRNTMHAMVEQIAADLGIRWAIKSQTDRGDGLMIVTKKSKIELMVTELPRRLSDSVRRYNLTTAPDMQMKLRMAVDAGYVHKDTKGYSGDVLNRTARLLDAPEFKMKIREQGAELAVIASIQLCEAISGFHLLDDRRLQKVSVDVKETHTTAFMWIP